MKIVFEFDSVEDAEEHKVFAQAIKMNFVLHDLQQELRDFCKYQKATKRDHYWKERLRTMLEERKVELGT